MSNARKIEIVSVSCIQETMATVNIKDKGKSPPLVLSGDNRGHDDDSTTSDVTWPELDGHLGDLAQIHDPGYYKLSLAPEHSPIPSVVSCIQLEETKTELEETKTDNEDQDVTSEYINEIVELKLQLANYRTEIDELKASLNRCMLDNEALLAEKSALVDEIAHYRQPGLDESAMSGLDGSSYSTSSLRSSILSMGRRKSDQRKNGSIKMLLESNSQLLLQNSHLQVENNALRKSLQTNILGNRQRRREDRELMSNDVQQHHSGHRRASLVTLKTATETLSVSSPMPDHWPALNDPYLDEVKSDEMSSHASTGAWVGGHDERQNRIYDDDLKWPASGSHTDDENESHDSNDSCSKEQDCNDINLFSSIGSSWASGMYPSLIEKRRRFTLGKRHSM